MKLYKSFSVKEISNYTGAEILSSSNALEKINFLFYDSRKIYSTTQQSIFIAINSGVNDGHRYIHSAYKKGVRNFLVSTLPDIIEKDATYLMVKDTVAALQSWAKAYRTSFKSNVIGITGSNGKTIVKEWLYQLLFSKVDISRSPLSFNSQIGLPISVLLAPSNSHFNVFEVGISRLNEMDALESVLKPRIAVLSSFGVAHREGFQNAKEHLQEKLKLFQHADVLVLPGDDSTIVEEANDYLNNSHKKLITFGLCHVNTIYLISKKEINNGYELKLSIDNNPIHIFIPFTDEVSIQNLLCVFAIIYAMCLQPKDFTKNAQTLCKVEMRLETLLGINNSILINDSFNSDLTSLYTALDTLFKYNNKTKHLVLSDFYTVNPQTDYQEVAERVNLTEVNYLYLIGSKIKEFSHLFKAICVGVDKAEDLLKSTYWNLSSNDVVLIKGSRNYGLNILSEFLQRNSHDTTVEVNLEKLNSNVKAFQSVLSPNTKLMCMVKAFSYGIGDAEIAQSLQNQGVDYFGVAYAQEGVDLRNKDINTPIMVMNPEVSSYSQIIDYELEPEIYSFRVLNLFIDKLISKGYSAPYPIHIKLNTGMNRLGFMPNDIIPLVDLLKNNRMVKVVSLFSHLSSADDKNESNFTHNQAEMLSSFHRKLSLAVEYPIMKHICNSAGIVNYPEYHFDMVRLGIGMYGFGLSPIKQTIKPIFKLRTLISQIHHLEKGESIGYNRTHVLTKTSKIAVLPIGYADGISRLLGNGMAKFLVNKQWAQSIGRVCMDMVMIDVTNIKCKEGDEVYFYEEPYGVEYYSKLLKTIPYELITSLSYRLKRIYFHE